MHRARKYNTGTIIITQQPSDFVADGILMHGKAIFDNSFLDYLSKVVMLILQ